MFKGQKIQFDQRIIKLEKAENGRSDYRRA